MKLYKFRPLASCCNLERIIEIIDKGFYCCDLLSFNDVNEGVFLVSNKPSNVNLDLKLKYKICSFSTKKALKSQLMWGHYANAGMGVAIEIKLSNKSQFEEVIYGEQCRFENVKEVLSNKSKEWDYENEWRYISETEETLYPHKIEKLYFGVPYSKLENYEELKSKHSKLQKYLELLERLKTKCLESNITVEEYEIPHSA